MKRKKEIIIHVDAGRLEPVMDALHELEGVELAAVNYMDTIRMVPKAGHSKGQGKGKKKRTSSLAGKGAMEGLVRQSIASLPEARFTLEELAGKIDGKLDNAQLMRALDRLVRKKEMKRLAPGKYFAPEKLRLAAVANG